jgi:predicted metal-dependent peptidase
MSDQEVQKGIGELFSLSREAEIDSINFDTEVDEASFKTWSKSKKHPWVRTRCGGTDFECVRRFINKPENKKRWTGVVMFTDGYAAGLGQIIGVRVLWLITESGSMDVIRPGDLVVQMKFPKKITTK